MPGDHQIGSAEGERLGDEELLFDGRLPRNVLLDDRAAPVGYGIRPNPYRRHPLRRYTSQTSIARPNEG